MNRKLFFRLLYHGYYYFFIWLVTIGCLQSKMNKILYLMRYK